MASPDNHANPSTEPFLTAQDVEKAFRGKEIDRILMQFTLFIRTSLAKKRVSADSNFEKLGAFFELSNTTLTLSEITESIQALQTKIGEYKKERETLYQQAISLRDESGIKKGEQESYQQKVDRIEELDTLEERFHNVLGLVEQYAQLMKENVQFQNLAAHVSEKPEVYGFCVRVVTSFMLSQKITDVNLGSIIPSLALKPLKDDVVSDIKKLQSQIQQHEANLLATFNDGKTILHDEIKEALNYFKEINEDSFELSFESISMLLEMKEVLQNAQNYVKAIDINKSNTFLNLLNNLSVNSKKALKKIVVRDAVSEIQQLRTDNKTDKEIRNYINIKYCLVDESEPPTSSDVTLIVHELNHRTALLQATSNPSEESYEPSKRDIIDLYKINKALNIENEDPQIALSTQAFDLLQTTRKFIQQTKITQEIESNQISNFGIFKLKEKRVERINNRLEALTTIENLLTGSKSSENAIDATLNEQLIILRENKPEHDEVSWTEFFQNIGSFIKAMVGYKHHDSLDQKTQACQESQLESLTGSLKPNQGG